LKSPAPDTRKMHNPIFAVDIGASKIASCWVLPGGRVEQVSLTPTEAQQGGEAVMRKVIQVCQAGTQKAQLFKEEKFVKPAAIGISTAGQIDFETGRVIFATQNMPGWTGMEVRQRIETALEMQTCVENDVNCFALGEAYCGAGKGLRHVLCLAIGTGIGGAIIIDGRLYRGWKGSAGELGHISIDYRGNPCNCGARGCVETYAAGPAIEAAFQQQADKFPGIQEQEVLSCRGITQLAQGGDEFAARVLRTAGDRLGTCLAGLLNLLNPEAVILGGGVLESNDIYLEAARLAAREKALPPMKDTPILKSKLPGSQAQLVGAAALCWQASAIQ